MKNNDFGLFFLIGYVFSYCLRLYQAKLLFSQEKKTPEICNNNFERPIFL